MSRDSVMIGLSSYPAAHLRRVCISVIFSVLFMATLTKLKAQDRCGTVEYTKILQKKKRVQEDVPKFEKWLSRRIENTRARTAVNPVYTIPVVVHVIHNGENIGTGVNISQAQVASQISVLNKDFKRLNADTTNTPSDFSSLAGKINIEFALAKQTPDGRVSDGIVRVKGTKRQWTMDDNETLKALSYWPAEDYLNIWITDIASSILGYAQFPVSDLPGLEDVENNRLTDGVVLDYRVVGSNQDGSFNLTSNFNRGRTATHEIGHFLGLRHIWGDDEGACSGGGDYVDDTPDQGNSSDGCPSHPRISCNTRAMFQNYMDYTNDVCMNLYTKKQVERMLTVLENSPRRASLLTSNGIYDPAPVPNDLAILEVLAPVDFACAGIVIPRVAVRNDGSNIVTTAKIQLSVNNTIVQVKDEIFPSLAAGDKAEVAFDAYALMKGGNHFRFEILETNFSADGKSNDNTATLLTEVPYEIPTPFTETFDPMPGTWRITTNGDTGWALAVPNNSNSALSIKFFQSDDEIDELDIVTSPVFDLSQATAPFVAFDVAYGRFQNHSDGLEVYALLDCNTDLSGGELIYAKYGSALATVSNTSTAFSPQHEYQWRREVLDLYQFIGQSHVQLAFVAINDNGNNLYLDNIGVRRDVSENIAIGEIVTPSPVQCRSEVQPSLQVRNEGAVPIDDITVSYGVNNQEDQTFHFEALALQPGAQTTLLLPAIQLNDGENVLAFELMHPNGFQDIDTTDNTMWMRTIVHDGEDKIPLRKNFDAEEGGPSWQLANPRGALNWTMASTNYGTSLYFEGNAAQNDATTFAWFVSPVLDFSGATVASVFFDISYRYRNRDSIKDTQDEVFRVMISRDCGLTFEPLLGNTDFSLANRNSTGDGTPDGQEDWSTSFINLNSFAGETTVRVAFVVSSAIAHALYLDNIEFFLSDDPSPAMTSDLYSLYPNILADTKSFYITFNLLNRQDVAYELIDMSGKQIGTKELTDVLNQTYKIDVENASNGVYMVRLFIDNKYYVSRIVVSQ